MMMVEAPWAIIAKESTDGWNNAGTGHAAYCELNSYLLKMMMAPSI